MRVALIQLNSRDDKSANLSAARELIESVARAEHPDLIVLPEVWTYQGGTLECARESAEPAGDGEAYRMLAGLAADLKCVIHGGSFNERAGGQVFNTSFVFDAGGREVARYRKIHLFDMLGPDDAVYKESALYSAGSELATFRIGDLTFGCAICYDLRFPQLFAGLVRRGAEAIVLPSAFTLMTGLAHWEVLCRARAIETQTYFLAPNQVGPYSEDGETRVNFGSTLAVSPWGQVTARAEDRVGHVVVTIDRAAVLDVRQRMPVAQHQVQII